MRYVGCLIFFIGGVTFYYAYYSIPNTPPPQNLQYGTHGALKPPKRVWGKSRTVTHNYPTRLGALRAVLSYSKHSGVSWVWLAIVTVVKVKCTLGGLMLRFWAI